MAYSQVYNRQGLRLVCSVLQGANSLSIKVFTKHEEDSFCWQRLTNQNKAACGGGHGACPEKKTVYQSILSGYTTNLSCDTDRERNP